MHLHEPRDEHSPPAGTPPQLQLPLRWSQAPLKLLLLWRFRLQLPQPLRPLLPLHHPPSPPLLLLPPSQPHIPSSTHSSTAQPPSPYSSTCRMTAPCGTAPTPWRRDAPAPRPSGIALRPRHAPTRLHSTCPTAAALDPSRAVLLRLHLQRHEPQLQPLVLLQQRLWGGGGRGNRRVRGYASAPDWATGRGECGAAGKGSRQACLLSGMYSANGTEVKGWR